MRRCARECLRPENSRAPPTFADWFQKLENEGVGTMPLGPFGLGCGTGT